MRAGEGFWKGGTDEGGGEDQRSSAYDAPARKVIPATLWGMSWPWTLQAGAALGVWLMASPSVFGTQGTLADSNHLIGALVATFAVIALAEVTRAARYVNIPAGLWIAVSPFLLGGASDAATFNAVIAGLLIVLLSVPRRRVREGYDTWQRYVR